VKISFYRDHGAIREIGKGHLYRTKAISRELAKRGHSVANIEDDVLYSDLDALVIDHIHSQKEIIMRAKQAKIKVILIDGAVEDVALVDVSISAMYNPIAQFSGLKYVCIPTEGRTNYYSVGRKSKNVFVAMGGFDANNIAEMIVDALGGIGLYAIVAKSINHDFAPYSNMEFFEEENYYDAMNECTIAVTNGGLSLFQLLYYGMPCVAIPQYKHQSKNISFVSGCCVKCMPEKDEIKEKVKFLMDDEYAKIDFSIFGSNVIDGKGCERVCDIIEGVHDSAN